MSDQVAAAPRLPPETAVTLAGAALVLTLVEVGFASGEMIRHAVQASPVVLATLVAWRRPDLGRWALGPIFLFWLLISIGIWMFLLGLPSPLKGTFNLWERVGAAGLGLASLAGVSVYPRVRRLLAWYWGAAVLLVFAGLQFEAFRISTLPAISHR